MFQHILVPVDSSPCSRAAVALAARLCRAWGSQLSLAHIYEGHSSQAAQELLEQFLSYTRQTPNLILEPMQENLAKTLVLLAEHEHSELILIGTHVDAHLERQAIGSVARDVAVQARIPVLIVPAESKKIGFEARWATAVLPSDGLKQAMR